MKVKYFTPADEEFPFAEERITVCRSFVERVILEKQHDVLAKALKCFVQKANRGREHR